MGLFNIDSPLMKVLTRIGNLILVSLFWAVSLIPVFTLIPASAALYHTVSGVARVSGAGVFRDYVSAFKANFKQGTLLSLICIGLGFILYFCTDFGYQLSMYTTGYIYFVMSVFICVLATGTVLLIPPVLSRFHLSLMGVVRLSLYLVIRHPLRTVITIVLFAVSVFLGWYFPIAVMILPGAFIDLVCNGVEKSLVAFTIGQGITADSDDVTDASFTSQEELAATQQADQYDSKN